MTAEPTRRGTPDAGAKTLHLTGKVTVTWPSNILRRANAAMGVRGDVASR